MKDNELIQLPATFTGFGSRSDGGASLRFATQELTDVDFAQLKKIHNEYGWIVFKPDRRLTPEEIPSENAPEKSGKSQSQKLRAVIYLIWEAKSDPKIPFENYYHQEMNVLIEMYKDMIERKKVNDGNSAS